MTEPIAEPDYLGRISAAARNLSLPSLLRLRSILDKQVDETAESVMVRMGEIKRLSQRDEVGLQ